MKTLLFPTLLAAFVATAAAACGDEGVPTAPRFEITPEPAWAGPVAVGPDGTVYVTYTPFFGPGTLYAFDRNGKARWTAGLGGTPAIGLDGTIHVAGGGYLWALDASGNVLWKADAGGVPAVAGDGVVYLAAELEDESIVSATQLIAVAPGGSILWESTLYGTPSGRPVVSGNGTILVPLKDPSGTQASLQAVTREGAASWGVALSGDPGELAIDGDGTIYVGDATGLRALNPDGTEKWKVEVAGGVKSPVLGLMGRIFAVGGGGLAGFDVAGAHEWNNAGIAPAGLAVGRDGTLFAAANVQTNLGLVNTLVAVNPSGNIVRTYNTSFWTAFAGPPAIGPGGEVYVSGHNVISETTFTDLGGGNERMSGSVAVEGKLASYRSTSKGLAKSAWPRNGADNGGSGLAVAEVSQPSDVTGMWAASPGSEHRVVDLRKDGSFTLYRYDQGAEPAVDSEGSWSYDGANLTLAGKVRKVYASSTVWALDMDDPVDGKKRTFRRVYAPPAPPSPSSDWGTTVHTLADGVQVGSWGGDLAVLGDGSIVGCGSWNKAESFGDTLPDQDKAVGLSDLFCGAVGPDGWSWVTYFYGDLESVTQIEATPDGNVLVFGRVPDPSTGAVVDALLLGPDGTPGKGFTFLDHSVRKRFVHSLAVDPSSGDLVLAGETIDATRPDYDYYVADAFLSRYTKDGALLWERHFPGAGVQARESFSSVSISPNGTIGVAGSTEGPVDLGTGVVGPEAPSTDPDNGVVRSHLLVASFDGEGNTLWARAYANVYAGGAGGAALRVGLDGEDHLVVAGPIALYGLNLGLGAMAVGEDAIENDQDVFVARFDPEGNPLWSQQVFDPDWPNALGGLAVDPWGNILVAAGTDKDAFFGAQPLTTKGGKGFFAFQLDACGAILWKKDVRPDFVTASAVAAFPGGDLALTGPGPGGVQDIGDAFLDWSEAHAIQISLDLEASGFWVARIRGAGEDTLDEDGAIRTCDAGTGGAGGTGQVVEVDVDGKGDGQVVSTPPGIACPPTCEHEFPSLSQVTLTAVPDAGSHFTGWDEDCDGLETCQLVMTQDREVEARFEPPGLSFGRTYAIEHIKAVDAVPGGGIAVAGYTDAGWTADLGSGPVTVANQEVFVLVVDGDGTPVWGAMPAGDGYDFASGVAGTPDGGVVLAGATASGVFDAGTGPLPSTTGGTFDYNTFAVRYDASGNPVWSKRFTNISSSGEVRAAVSGDGTVWLAENPSGLRSLSPAGEPLLSLPMPNAWIDSMAGTKAGGVVLTGGATTDLVLDGVPLGVPGGSEFLLGLDPSGAVSFVRHVSAAVGQFPKVDVAADGRIAWTHHEHEASSNTPKHAVVVHDAAGNPTSTVLLPDLFPQGVSFLAGGLVAVVGGVWPGIQVRGLDPAASDPLVWTLPIVADQATSWLWDIDLAPLAAGDAVLAGTVKGSTAVGPFALAASAQAGFLVRVGP